MKADRLADVTALAAASGGFVDQLEHHVLAHLPQGARRLVVTFDNLLTAKREDQRLPWGHEFLLRRSWDVLGVMAWSGDWFRAPDLWARLEALADEGFFKRYDHVAMYGASMGAFGALTFARLAPGCTVVAFAPQSSLSKTLAPFENRYRFAARTLDWSGPYCDAAEGARAAGRAYILFDPMEALDRAHAARMSGPNLTLLHMRFSGHKLPPALKRMMILKDVVDPALEGRLEPWDFIRLHRLRRNSVPYLASVLTHAASRGHTALGLPLADALLRAQPHHRLRAARRALREARRTRAANDTSFTSCS